MSVIMYFFIVDFGSIWRRYIFLVCGLHLELFESGLGLGDYDLVVRHDFFLLVFYLALLSMIIDHWRAALPDV